MKYIKSFITCIVISFVVWGVFEFMIASGFIFTWVQLQNPPTKPIKLVGLYPGLYSTIVIKSEDGKNYYNYGGKESKWIGESDFVFTEEDLKNSSMTDCNIDEPMFISLFITNRDVVECYQYYVKYPEASANLTVVLDQNGNIWENHKWLVRSGLVTVSRFILVLLLAIILKIFWLVIIAVKKILFRFQQNSNFIGIL
jgi:hypothetical protein